MLSVCYHGLPQILNLLASGEDPLSKRSENDNKPLQIRCQTQKLVAMHMLLLSRALESSGKHYMSYVVAKVGLMNVQETCGLESPDFLELIRKYVSFSYGKVTSYYQYGEYVQEEDELASLICGEKMPYTPVAKLVMNNSIIRHETRLANVSEGGKKAKDQILLVNLDKLRYELDAFSESRKPVKRAESFRKSSVCSSKSISVGSKRKRNAVFNIFNNVLEVKKAKDRLKILVQLSGSNTYHQSTMAMSSQNQLESVSGLKPTNFIIKGSTEEPPIEKRSMLLDINQGLNRSHSLNGSKELSTAKARLSVRKLGYALGTVLVKDEVKKPFSKKSKSELANYFLSRSQEPPKKPKMFFTDDSAPREIQLPRRKFRHVCFASAIPSLDDDEKEDDGRFKDQVPDYDIFTVKAAPSSVYMKSNDMAGMLDDCLLGTFNSRRSSQAKGREENLQLAKDNINKR